MKQIATMRVSQVAAKYGENAPLATTCCNACRACVQTNLLGLAVAAVAGVGLAVRRAGRRGDNQAGPESGPLPRMVRLPSLVTATAGPIQTLC